MFGTNESEFQNELLLTDTQVAKLRNQSSADMELSKNTDFEDNNVWWTF